MKRILQILAVTLLLMGTVSQTKVFDGPEPVPTCDPTTTKNCQVQLHI